MMKLKILSVGKTKESWLEQGLNEYVRRLSSVVLIEFVWVKDDVQLLRFTEKESPLVCLDPDGQQMDSECFAQFVQNQFHIHQHALHRPYNLV